MSYEIRWSPLAKDDYIQTVSYIYDTWGELSAEKFKEDLESSLRNLGKFPFIGKQSALIPSVRQLVISKQQRLFYTVFDNIVLVLNISDSRMQH